MLLQRNAFGSAYFCEWVMDETRGHRIYSSRAFWMSFCEVVEKALNQKTIQNVCVCGEMEREREGPQLTMEQSKWRIYQ